MAANKKKYPSAPKSLEEILPDLRPSNKQVVEGVDTSKVNWHQFLNQYEYNPSQFVRDIWKIDPFDWQAEAMEKIASGTKRLAIRSGHRTGKSTMCAWLVIWWMMTRHPQKTCITAPTKHQLFDALYAETKSWIDKLPPELRQLVKYNSERITYILAPNDSFTSIKTSGPDNTEALAGAHSAHTLLVVDEASVVPVASFNSAGSVMGGPDSRMIIIGNPTQSTGYFFDAFHKNNEIWDTMHVPSIGDSDASRDYIESVAIEAGVESNEYRFRILGEFPLADNDTLIASADVDFAMNRTAEEVPDDMLSPLIYGVDISRFGDDNTVLVKRRGRVVLDIQFWNRQDLMATVGRIKAEADTDHPAEICVDSIGIGAGVADRLRELGLNCYDVNVSERAAMNPKCDKLRDELWWAMREFLQKKDVRLPSNERLRADLCAPTYTYTSNGKIKVESKDRMKTSKRLGRSPDFADALGCTFAGTAAMIGGGFSSSIWNKPIRRFAKGYV